VPLTEDEHPAGDLGPDGEHGSLSPRRGPPGPSAGRGSAVRSTGPSGFAVTSRTCTRLLLASMANRQDRRRVTAQSGWKEAGGEHRRCPGVQELPPGGAGVPLRCRGNLQGFGNPADRRCADPVTEFQQLALDPVVSRPGPITRSRTFPRSGSRVGPSLAASSANTSEPHKSPVQGWWPSSGPP
jgi:hypothetical protein